MRAANPAAPVATSRPAPPPPTPAARVISAPAPGLPAGRPINPFLSQDPGQKARRLARALVSDLAVYHPERRLEALKNGTLKEAFGDEIKKSWDEYAEQVGRDLAESTTFFTDALNDILAGGQKVF